MQRLQISLFSIAAALRAGHAALVQIGTKLGLGVNKSTALDLGDAIRVSSANPCVPDVNLESLSSDSAAATNDDGTPSLSVFQVNGDGAGPFNVILDTSATGNNSTRTSTSQLKFLETPLSVMKIVKRFR